MYCTIVINVTINFFRLSNINKFVKFPPAQQHLLRWILPTLVSSLKNPSVQSKIQATTILTTLVENNSIFQKIAGDLGAIDELCEILKSTAKEPKKDTKEEEAKKPKVKYFKFI